MQGDTIKPFYRQQKFLKSQFSSYFSETNPCTRFLQVMGYYTTKRVRARGLKVELQDIMDMNRYSSNADQPRADLTLEEVKTFQKCCKDEQESASQKQVGLDAYWMLLKALFATCKARLAWCILICTVSESFAVFASFYIGSLIRYVGSAEPGSLSEGATKIFVFFVAQAIAQTMRNTYVLQGYQLALSMRRALIISLYDKVVRLSMKSMAETNSGKLISLISADLVSIERGMSFMPLALATPLINLLAYYFLYLRMGIWYTLTTVAVWILLMLLQIMSTSYSKELKQIEGAVNDDRLKVANDLVIGCRTIKCFGWEAHYEGKIKAIRRKQERLITKLNIVSSLGNSFYPNMGLLALMIILLSEWQKGEVLETDVIMSLLSIIYFVFYSVNYQAFIGLTNFQNFLAIVKRLSTIFEMEECLTLRDTSKPKEEALIELQDCAFSWGFRVKDKQQLKTSRSKVQVEVEEQPIIRGLNFRLTPGSLLAIIGKVGAGKSTLLHSIMEETHLTSGKMKVQGTIAYVEQEPFIISGSIKDNILLGKTFDQVLFNKAIKVSQLIHDVSKFQKGADTVIGERGINISGGQKARISLARAVYSEAEIVLLDDPLSAVDPQVANKIFEECILGELKDRIVILVTHQVQQLTRSSAQILVIEDNQQRALGDYASVSEETGLNIDEILQCHNEKLKELKQQATEFTQEVKPAVAHPESAEKDEKELAQSKANEPAPAEKPKKEVDLIVPEDCNDGTITFDDLLRYLKFSTGTSGIFWFLLFGFGPAFAQLATTYWISYWTEQPSDEQQRQLYPAAVLGIVLFFVVFNFLRVLYIIKVSQTSSTGLHNSMVDRVIRSKILFFDSNPVGRILTRFSKDVTVLDLSVPLYASLASLGIFRTLSVAIVVAFIYPPILVVVFVALIIMARILNFTLGSLREMARADAIYRGPIHSSFTNVVNGLVSLRAYERVGFFREAFVDQIEKSCNVTFSYFSVHRFLSLSLDVVCLLFSLSVACFTVLAKDKMDNDVLAFTLQIITDVVVFFAFSMRTAAELETALTSAQRIYRYTELEPEDDLSKPLDNQLDSKPEKLSWPQRGEIEFSSCTMRYREGLEPSLRNLTCRIQGQMKVGIVGRTGAGKSSIIQTLFRLCDLESGSIKIDGVDIREVGLHKLRKSIAFIPQAPFLLQGTIRENLDPFIERTDAAIWDALQEVHLFKYVQSLSHGLDTVVSESNNLFSVGQKQLICLARSILRESKILVLDEATANVDLETDNLIQQKLRESFTSRTVLIIAHRLATVIDADRILVMKNGEAAEFDHPFNLLATPGDSQITKRESVLSQMMLATGEENAQSLFEIAKQSHKRG